MLSVLTASALVLPVAALAQEGGEASSIVEAEKVPRVLVVGFQDLDDEDCNTKFSRYGRCVEEVRFVDLDAARDPKQIPVDLERGQWRNTSRLYSEMWEQMAYRWPVDGDPISLTYVAEGAEFLPTAKQQWQATARDPKKQKDDLSVYSLPRTSLWLLEDNWVDPRVAFRPDTLALTELVANTDAFYPVVRVKKAAGLVGSPAMVVLKGRFAARLAVDNKRYPYDIMDGDPEASGPIFEQMYPYQRGMAAEDDDSEVPLTRFIVEEQLKVDGIEGDLVGMRANNFSTTLLSSGVEGYDRMFDLASEEFERFYRLVGVQILRFAREEYTPTHIRVLTSLMAMESPPRYGTEGLLGGAEFVAAAKGQTDERDGSILAFGAGFSRSRGFEINFSEYPPELIERHIVNFEEWTNPSEEFKRSLLTEVVSSLEDYLREGMREGLEDEDTVRRYVFPSLSDSDIKVWIKNFSFPGQVPTVSRYFKRIALKLMVQRLDEEAREEIQTEMLLDHVNLRIRQGFGGPDSPLVPPQELEDKSQVEWLQVLQTHTMYPEPIPDKPGAVDPVAICTTQDRIAALAEPSFGKIDVDQIVVASGWLKTTEELLWEVREQLPFIMIDDPSRNPPDVTRLVGLPGDRAIYRIRWQVWSGWHFLWAVEPLSEADEAAPRRMALRTAALCEDMVIASPDVVPTLARAALLDGKFRPAVPVRDHGKTKKPGKSKGNDEQIDEAEGAVSKETEVERSAETVKTASEGDVGAIQEVGQGAIGGLRALGEAAKRRREGVDTTPITDEVVSYLQDLMLSPIRAMIGDKPLFLAVFDHGSPGEKEKIWDYRPRSPYVNAQTRLKDGKHLRSSGWGWHMGAPEAEISRTLVVPAYLPSEILNTSELKQYWKRRATSDWNFGGDLGFFPYKYTRYSCREESDAANNGVVADCNIAGGGPPRGAEGEGISVGLTALNTQWLLDDRRVAIEFGPEVHIDILHRGQSFFYDGDVPLLGVAGRDVDGELTGDVIEPIQYNWSFLFQAGLVAGVRFAPDPGPMHRRRGRRLPWGSPLPDGSSILGRMQGGIRGGFLLGPSWDGLVGTGLFEGWLGWSIRNPNGKQASFTPYHPAIVVGPYARVQYTFGLQPNLDRFYQFNDSVSIVVGLRAQFRLTAQPEMPELSAPEAP